MEFSQPDGANTMIFTGIPLWLAGLLATVSAGALVALHLLRIRPQPLRVVTTMFWAHAIEQPDARTLWQRFRHRRTFAFLLLVTLLMVAALLRPEPADEPGSRGWTVLVLDAGASMAVTQPGASRSRLDAARAVAEQEIAALPRRDRLAVVVADPWPRVVHGFDDPPQLAPRRFADITPGGAPASTDAALRLAHSLVVERKPARIVLVTDRTVSINSDPAGDPALHVRRVGAATDNAAILAVTAAPHALDPFRTDLYVRAGFWGTTSREIGLEIRREGGAVLLSERRTLAPGATAEWKAPDLPADGDAVWVTLSPTDALPTDDRAQYRLPLATAVRVAMTKDTPPALRRALLANPIVRVVAWDADPAILVARADTSPDRPAITWTTDGPPVVAGRSVEVNKASPLADDLDFEAAACGSGSALARAGDDSTALLLADDAVLAALTIKAGQPQLRLAEALLAPDSSIPNRAAFAVLMTRALWRLAGWQAAPITLTPERVLDDPLWTPPHEPERAVAALPASRSAGNLAALPAVDESPVPRRSPPLALAYGEWLILLALGGLLVDALLHVRGRIP